MVPMISYGVLAGTNHSPIILEDIKENQKTIKKIDTLGNYSEYNQYEKVTDTYNVIYFYGKWYQKNGMYERKIKKYTINSNKVINELVNKNIDEVKELLNDENLLENNFITDINQEFIETKNDITNEEKESYIEIILYYENNEEFIIRKQTVNENFTDIIKYFILTIVMEIIVMICEKRKKEEIKEKNKQYQEVYRSLDIETLQKKLVIRKNNLERLMR